MNLSKIKFEEAQVKRGSNEKERAEKKKIVEEMIKRSWNPECMEVHTDGSVEERTKNGGAGYVASFKNQKWVERKATGERCSLYKAEMMAMLEAVKLIKEIKPKKANIWTDSRNLFTALRQGKDVGSGKLKEVRSTLQENQVRRVILALDGYQHI